MINIFSIQTVYAAETAEVGGLASLGIDPFALIFQIINFVILFFILKKFVFIPISKTLENRKELIEKQTKQAEEVEQDRLKWKEEKASLLSKARDEANRVIDESKKSAEEVKNSLLIKAREEQEKIVAKAKSEIKTEQEKAFSEARNALASLVIKATRVITKETVSPKENDEIIKKTLKEIK